MTKQGFTLSADEVRKVVQLLSTELTIGQIAKRLNCSNGVVVAINRKYQVREVTLRQEFEYRKQLS